MSALRDVAAALVGKVSAQTLAATHGLTQTPDELRGAWLRIKRDSDALLDELNRYEPLLEAVELCREVGATGYQGDDEAVKAATEAARRLMSAIDRFVTPTPKGKPKAATEGWSRAGDAVPSDLQLPPGDREPPASGGSPPP